MPAPIQVVMLDLMSIVPYYTGHLCAALQSADSSVRATLAAVTYSHDPGFFERAGVRNDAMLFDLAYRAPRRPAAIRVGLRATEYLANLTALLARSMAARPDILHVQFLPLLSHGIPVELWFVRAMRALGCRIVCTVHNVLPQDTGNRYRTVYGKLYRMADRLICHDGQSARLLAARFDIPLAQIDIIPHGPLFQSETRTTTAEAKRRLGIDPDETVTLWQGIIRPYKGLEFLLNVWKDVCASNSRARLVIAGTGDPQQLSALREQVSALNLQSRVRLDLRFLSTDELKDFYDAADIVVYPYSEITTSGALMTGIAAGKAIVASSVPTFEEALEHGRTALLVPYGDVSGWAGALLQLHSNAALRQSLGDQLRASLRNRVTPWSEIAALTQECYRAALQPRLVSQPEGSHDRQPRHTG